MFYLQIGLRNIIKNFRRSFITMISIIIGMTACLLIHGFFNWNIHELKESMIHNGTGHYQLYALGYAKYGSDDPYQYLIEDANPIIKELREIPEVKLVTTRMNFSGILSLGDKSTVVVGEAGIPEQEAQLNLNTGLIKGNRLQSAKPDSIVIADGATRNLSAKIGDTLTLMGNMKDGGINAVDLELTGITHSGNEDLDNTSASTSLGVIQNLLNIENHVQKIVVLLKNTADTPKVLPKVKEICKKYHLEYKNWESLAEFYQSLKLMYNVVFYIIMFIVLTIVTFTVSNTVNMSLNERFREIGTIRALGTRRIQVALIFIAESSLLGAMGGLIGLFISYLFIGFTEFIGGLPVMIRGSGDLVWMRVFFHPDFKVTLICILLFAFVAMLASIIPSRRASKISITDALRWV